MQAAVSAIEYYLPEKTISTADLSAEFPEWSVEKIDQKTGIRERHIAAPDECASDMAVSAARKLFDSGACRPEQVDYVLLCTQSPDYFLPTTACVLHARLGLRNDCACFDINLGCSQYVYALSVADAMLSAGLGRLALVTTGDTMSRTVNPMDRALVPILGDAGSATLVGKAEDEAGFLGFCLGTNGAGAKHLMLPAGGFRMPISVETAIETTDAEGNVRSPENLFMNGAAIFHFAITVVPATIQKLLKQVSLSMDDIGLFLFHQANRYMLDYLVKKLAIPQEKTFFYLDDVGNTSGSTMPVVLAEAVRAGKVKQGQKVLMIVFGVGLSWAATVMTVPAALAAMPAIPREEGL